MSVIDYTKNPFHGVSFDDVPLLFNALYPLTKHGGVFAFDCDPHVKRHVILLYDESLSQVRTDRDSQRCR